MRSVHVPEASPEVSGRSVAVEAGETIAIMRRGRVVARAVPGVPPLSRRSLQASLVTEGDIDLAPSADPPTESVETL